MKTDITNLQFLGISLKKAKTLNMSFKLKLLYFFIYRTFFITNKENTYIKILDYSDGDFFIVRVKHEYDISINQDEYEIKNAIVLDGRIASKLNIRHNAKFGFLVETHIFTSKVVDLNDNKHDYLKKIKHIIFNENYCTINIDNLLEKCFELANLKQCN